MAGSTGHRRAARLTRTAWEGYVPTCLALDDLAYELRIGRREALDLYESYPARVADGERLRHMATGEICSYCGADLTDPDSILICAGPYCAARWAS